MSTMDELKNLVLQTLETNGILGQIRAQLRSCVFKVIDHQDQSLKSGCGFHWENPLAAKVIETTEGQLCAELIREFMNFYHMDYSTAVFAPECNLGEKPMTREELQGGVGMDTQDTSAPLLLQIVQMLKTGGGLGVFEGRPGTQSTAPGTAPEGGRGRIDYTAPNEEVAPKPKESASKEKPTPPMGALPPLSKGPGKLPPLGGTPITATKEDHSMDDEALDNLIGKDEEEGLTTEPEKKKLSDIDKKLEEIEKNEKKGHVFNKDFGISGGRDSKDTNEEDKYADEDFDEIVEEFLESDKEFGESEDLSKGHQRFFTESGGITVSQSLGLDPSVDSLALEDYDHIEPVEKVAV